MALADYLVPVRPRNAAAAQKARPSNISKVNICFGCQKACGGCSWSALDPVTEKPKFEPVPGWTAKPVLLNLGNYHNVKRLVETYHITACPEFVPDGNRHSPASEISDEQWALMLSRLRRKGEL